MNSIEADYRQASSSPSSLIRIRQRHYKTHTTGDNSSDVHDIGASSGRTRFKRLRKGDQPLPFAFNGPHSKIPLVNKALKPAIVPDAVSEKVSSLCSSHGGLVPGFAENRENMNSGSSDEDLGVDPESSEDISSGRREPTRDNGEKESLSDLHVLSDHGLLVSGSINPTLASENAMVRRPPSIPVPDADDGNCLPTSQFPAKSVKELDYELLINSMIEHCNQFLKSATQLNDAQKPRSLESGADAGARQEITRLGRKNTELSATIRVLTEELAGVRQELADSKSRELQLQLSLDEISDVLTDSWEY
ncbi:hypothetical protein MKW92_022611 [Papaver armeniacum]|nr:hypothetical protein MKW92_022611 [Papaver armeniacum]